MRTDGRTHARTLTTQFYTKGSLRSQKMKTDAEIGVKICPDSTSSKWHDFTHQRVKINDLYAI